MSQNSLTLPTTGTVSGLQMTQYANLALDTLNTLASGASAPSSPEAGQLWHDTTNNILKIRSLDNTTWITLFSINETSYGATPVVTSSTAGVSAATAANMATVVASMTGGFVNRFRNGTFDIWQRGTSGSVTSGSANYTADGWIVGASGATVSWAQTVNGGVSLPDSFRLTLTGNTSVSDTFVRQRIESYLAQSLAGEQVTVQFQVYNSTGAALTPTLTVKHASAQDYWGAPTTDVSGVSLQSCANNAFTTVAYTFAASASAYLGLEITLDFGAALSSNAKSVAVFAADIRATPGVSTGLNSSPPVVESRDVSTELAFCQRYFYSYNSPSSTIVPLPGFGLATGSTTWLYNVPLKVTSRIPFNSINTTSSSNFGVAGGGFPTLANVSAFSSINATTDSVAISGSVGYAAITSGQTLILASQASGAYIQFSGAEL